MATITKELCVQMQINHGNAAAGGAGATVGASAMITALVTLDGAPADNLGANVGNQTSPIQLPTGWTLLDGFNVRPFGSLVTVTEFLNQGSGLYDIRIVPYVNNPASTWLSGEYIYALAIKVSRTKLGKKTVLQGSALAKLIVP